MSKYQELISNLDSQAILLSNSLVGGRPISTYKIENLADYFGQEISVLEIPSPKENNVYNEGFEHVEFVINCSLESFVKQHPNVDFDVKNINKEINPEVRLKRQDKKISIKFHCQSLEMVIEWEKTRGSQD